MDKGNLKILEEKSAPKKYNKNAYPFDIKHCPGYEGYRPINLTHEVCKWCGNIKYYH